MLEDHFSIRNVSYGCHLLVYSARFLLCSAVVCAALPHLQRVVDLGPSVRLSFHHHNFLVWFFLSIHRIQCWVIACQVHIISYCLLPYDNFVSQSLAYAYWLPPANNILPQGQTSLKYDRIWYDSVYIACQIGKITLFWMHVLFSFPPVADIQYPRYTANLHRVGVVFTKIRINLPLSLWYVRLHQQNVF